MEATTAGSGPAKRCDLCEAAPISPWWWEDDVCWVADCEICETPMVVWRHHGADPGEEAAAYMVDRLSRIAADRFGANSYSIDRTMRQIPDHFHAHARDTHWYERRQAQARS